MPKLLIAVYTHQHAHVLSHTLWTRGAQKQHVDLHMFLD